MSPAAGFQGRKCLASLPGKSARPERNHWILVEPHRSSPQATEWLQSEGDDKLFDMEVLGPVLLVLSIPLLLRWVPRNYVYGFRIAATLRSDAVWYEVNALFGRHALLLGLLMIALELALPLSIRNSALRAVAFIGLATVIVADWRTANRLDREHAANS